MKTLHLRDAMLLTAALGVVLWLLRDYPIILVFVLFLSPTFVLTRSFLKHRTDRVGRVSWAERLSAWLLVSSVVIPLELMALLVIGMLLSLIAMLFTWLAGHSLD